KLSSGAMIFVNPWQYNHAIIALKDVKLYPDHVIFAESFEYLVAEVLEQHGTWVKDRSTLDIQEAQLTSADPDSLGLAEDGDEELRSDQDPGAFTSWQPLMFVNKTFVCLAPVKSSAITTASSTDVRNPNANPRRVEPPEL
ncbi:unnamed protein product, partial [Symbiodinium pilosum]